MNNILLTGGTGLIGKECIPFLLKKHLNIYVFTTNLSNLQLSSKYIHYIYCNIFDYDQVKKLLNTIKPKYLIHMAWLSTGLFDDNINYQYLEASLNLLRAFSVCGGERFVGAGTYAEYGKCENYIKEDAKTNPYNSYSFCKDMFNKIATSYCLKNNISYSWGRIFSAFGIEHDVRRLTGDIVQHFLVNEKLIIRNSSLIRDYIYSKDVAAAFVELLCSTVSGNVNICTGKGTSIKDFTTIFGRIFDKENLIEYENRESPQPNCIIGNPSKLFKEVGFIPSYSLERAVVDIRDELFKS